jgi:predicted ester cyclase
MTASAGSGTPEANKKLLLAYLEGFWNAGDYAVADRYIAKDAFFHDFVHQPEPIPQGLAGVKHVYSKFAGAFPGIKMILGDMMAEGDLVTVLWSVVGRQTGVFQGIPPTYKDIDFTGSTTVRIANGQIVEGWNHMDIMRGLTQLGVLPSGPLPAPMRWLIAFRGKREKRRRGL